MKSWGEVQLAVARDFQEQAVPRYRALFPPPDFEAPYYGRRDGVPLSYAEYVALVHAGERVARPIHGCLHAARVTLYAALLAQLHRRAGREVAELHPLQMAAAFHDAARLDEGRDRWDAGSAMLFAEWWQARGGDAEPWRTWLEEKDAPVALSLEHAILHDADALDIQRVAHIRGRFRPETLWLFRDGDGIAEADKRAVVDETRALIELTDRDDVKLELETAPDYYVKVMHIVATVQREHGALPLLDRLLHEVLES
jgi:hypothetical protein